MLPIRTEDSIKYEYGHEYDRVHARDHGDDLANLHA